MAIRVSRFTVAKFWNVFIHKYANMALMVEQNVRHFIRLGPNLTTSLMLCAFFWVIPRRLNFICRRFGTPCLFHLHRQVGMKYDSTFICRRFGTPCLFHLHRQVGMKYDSTSLKPSHTSECSETSAYKMQTRRNYPE